jgi:hypothetical protein
MGRWLILFGLLLVLLGIAWPLFDKLGLGRLPGDLRIEREGFAFYFPITSSLIISIIMSIVVSLLLWLFRR